MYTLLLKGGRVLDPANKISNIRDIAVKDGKIAAAGTDINPAETEKVISAKGLIVTPGLIDIHVHATGGLRPGGLVPDRCGVLSGVTTMVDAGSTGYLNFPEFKRLVIRPARTDSFCFINVAGSGLDAMPELRAWDDMAEEATVSMILAHRDIIRGVKIRAVDGVVNVLGIEAVRRAKKVAEKAGVPLVVHLGLDNINAVPEEKMLAFTREMLSILDKGDILAHVYTWRPGGVFSPGSRVLPELKQAIARGVLTDAATGRVHWSLEIARGARERGVIADILSTDLTARSISDQVFSLPVTMSKFLAAGFALEELVAMTTINPARAIGEEHRRGSLEVGRQADISVFELNEGDFIFADGVPGKTFTGHQMLAPRLVIKSGVEIIPEHRFENAS